MTYDVIVIGGGSAGLMAGIAASRDGAKVLLVDKGDKLGRKLGISGGGRCNVTNNKDMDELIKHIPGNGRFLYSAFTHFGNKDIIAFLKISVSTSRKRTMVGCFPSATRPKPSSTR